MFDRVEIRVKGGDGGNGAISFRREMHVPFGGPDGGDGGGGGNVVIMADASVTSLRPFSRNRLYQAADGGDGKGKKRYGGKGIDLVLRVPVGTAALAKGEPGGDVLIEDCIQPGQKVIVARGGEGGLGNTRFASSTNQVPRLAQKGEAGEERSLILEMRLIADVGIVGYPNVGKSTLLASATAAKPKIASYPFTTLEPVLGVVEVGGQSFVLAEIPGLVEGAHLGQGLGYDFLRHSLRTKMLIHLLDGTSLLPLQDMAQVNTELSLFEPTLPQKPQLVVVNKVDLPEVQARLAEMKDAFKRAGAPVLFISAATGEGVAEVMAETMKLLDGLRREVATGKPVLKKVFRPQPRGGSFAVHKEGDLFVVVAPELERIVARVDMARPEIRGQLRVLMDRLEVGKALGRIGIKPGDRVRCGQCEWQW